MAFMIDSDDGTDFCPMSVLLIKPERNIFFTKQAAKRD